MLTSLRINRLQISSDYYILYKYIVASLVIVVMVSGELFCLIIYNMLLLHRILIQYCLIVQYQIYT